MTPCTAPQCDGLSVVKGLCKSHYHRLVTKGHVGGPIERRVITKYKLLDALALDGGWLTLQGIMLLFPGASADGTSRALNRLEKAGSLESRTLRLGGNDRRKEWRIA